MGRYSLDRSGWLIWCAVALAGVFVLSRHGSILRLVTVMLAVFAALLVPLMLWALIHSMRKAAREELERVAPWPAPDPADVQE